MLTTYEEFENNPPNSNYYELSDIGLNENFKDDEEENNIQDNNIYFLRKVIERKKYFWGYISTVYFF